MTPLPDGFLDFARQRVGWEVYTKFRPYDPHKDYAGPENNPKFAGLIPDKFGPVSIAPAAWLHDELYAIGGDKTHRKMADDAFLDCMLWLIRNYSPSGLLGKILWAWRLRALAFGLAHCYHQAVRLGGCAYFSWAPGQSEDSK